MRKILISLLFLSISVLVHPDALHAQKITVQGDTLTTPKFITGYRDSLITEAHKNILLGDLSEGEQILWNILYEYPESDIAYYHLYSIYREQGDMAKALGAISKARELDPENYWYNLYYAVLSFYSGNTASAVAILEDLQKQYPDKVYIYYHLLNIYTSSKNTKKALETIDRIIDLQGENEQNGLYKYEILLNTAKLEDAYEYILGLSERVASPQIMLIAGDMLEYYDKDTLAMAKYDQAIQMDRSYPGPYNSKLAIYYKQEDYDSYLETVRVVIENDINSDLIVQGINSLAQNNLAMKNLSSRIDSLVDLAVARNGADTTVMEYATWYYVNRDQKEKALETAQLLTENLPEERRTWDNYIFTLNHFGEFDRTVEVLEQMIPAADDKIELYEAKSIILYLQKKTEEAVAVITGDIIPACKQQKDEERLGLAYLNIGDMRMQEDLDLSIKAYRTAMKYIPDNTTLLNNYAYTLALKGKQLKSAEEMALKALESEPENPTFLDTYAWILHRMKKDDEAKKVLQKAISMSAEADASLLDHFAEILYSLKEYDLAFMYWMQAASKDPSLNIQDKISQKKEELKQIRK